MKKGLRTLNEEVNRMKSLFGNDRLYGNLIVEGSVDDISKKKEEILKILSDWENFNNDRSGVVLFDGDMISSSVIKKQITPIIDDTQEKVTGINPKDVCNEENKKLIDDKIKSIGDNKKNPNYSFLPKEDKDYLNSLETKLKEIRELCSVNVNVEPVEKIQSLDTVDVVGKRNGEETPEEETPEEETPEEETPEEKPIGGKQTTSDELTERKCVDFVRDSFKMIRKSGDPTEWSGKYPDGKAKLIWCYKLHNKKLTQDGLFGPGNKTNELFSILKLKFPKVDDEKEKWYSKILNSFDIEKSIPIRRDGGAIILYVKNLEGKKYRFRSEKGMNIFDVINSKGKNKYLKKEIITLIKKQLDLGDDSKITVINGINTRGFDVGTFIIS